MSRLVELCRRLISRNATMPDLVFLGLGVGVGLGPAVLFLAD